MGQRHQIREPFVRSSNKPLSEGKHSSVDVLPAMDEDKPFLAVNRRYDKEREVALGEVARGEVGNEEQKPSKKCQKLLSTGCASVLPEKEEIRDSHL